MEKGRDNEALRNPRIIESNAKMMIPIKPISGAIGTAWRTAWRPE